MTKRKRIPKWRRLMIERRIAKINQALLYLDWAEDMLKANFSYMAKSTLNAVKELIK